MGIQKDMGDGDVAEKRLISILQSAGLESIKNPDPETRKFWDLEAILIEPKSDRTIAEFTIEVKNDRYAIRSHNIAIEIFNPKSKKHSGLGVTKADLWAIMVGEAFWIANTKQLQEWVEKTKPFRVIHQAGDGNATVLLFKADDILPGIFTRIDNIGTKDVNLLLHSLLGI